MKKKFVFEAVFSIADQELLVFSGSSDDTAHNVLTQLNLRVSSLSKVMGVSIELTHFTYQPNKEEKNGTQKKS